MPIASPVASGLDARALLERALGLFQKWPETFQGFRAVVRCAQEGDLEKALYDESIGEMKHADALIKRILFLESVPNLSDYDPIMVGQTVRQQLDNDLGLETAALALLRRGVQLCLEAGDHGSRELLEHIVEDEEEHVNWIEAQKHQIQELGYENYLAQQIRS
jgi:bacterioferritin